MARKKHGYLGSVDQALGMVSEFFNGDFNRRDAAQFSGIIHESLKFSGESRGG